VTVTSFQPAGGCDAYVLSYVLPSFLIQAIAKMNMVAAVGF